MSKYFKGTTGQEEIAKLSIDVPIKGTQELQVPLRRELTCADNSAQNAKACSRQTKAQSVPQTEPFDPMVRLTSRVDKFQTESHVKKVHMLEEQDKGIMDKCTKR